jgi:hypothetical protein
MWLPLEFATSIAFGARDAAATATWAQRIIDIDHRFKTPPIFVPTNVLILNKSNDPFT